MLFERDTCLTDPTLRRKEVTLERKKAAEERRRLEEDKAKVVSLQNL